MPQPDIDKEVKRPTDRPAMSSETNPNNAQNIPIDDIWVDDDFNCRGNIIFDVEINKLALDIQAKGLIQPVVVVPNDKVCPDGKVRPYKLVAGFRRTHAHRYLQRKIIWATIRPELKDNVIAQTFLNLTENMLRVDLNIVQEAKTIAKLMALGSSIKHIATELGKTSAWVEVRRIVLNQPQDIQDEIAKDLLSQEQIKQFKFLTLEQRYAFIRQVKEAKFKKESTRQVLAPKTKKDYTSKKYRKPGELAEMLDIIYDLFGPSFTTRVLAWGCANISTVELFADMVEMIQKDPLNDEGLERSLDIPLMIKNDVLAEISIRRSKRKQLNEASIHTP